MSKFLSRYERNASFLLSESKDSTNVDGKIQKSMCKFKLRSFSFVSFHFSYALHLPPSLTPIKYEIEKWENGKEKEKKRKYMCFNL